MMRIPTRTAFSSWLLLLTLAWLAVTPGIGPLVDAQGVASGWWQLRQQALYLTGVWAIGLMALTMLLALRLPWLERPLGGMDQVYRLHKWAGIGAALAAIAHWGAKESSGWIRQLWGRAGKPAREAVLPWLTDSRGLAKDLGEWAFYLLLALVALTLLTRLLAYRPWRWLHRAMPVLFLLLAFHSLALTPLAWWSQPTGLLMAGLLALGSAAALWSLAGGVGRRRQHAGRVHAVQALGGQDAPLEVICALAPSWPGHRAGQFAFVHFHAPSQTGQGGQSGQSSPWGEGAHPFTIASAQDSLGRSPQGEPLLRLVIKPLGDYTARLHRHLTAGQALTLEGPYGRFDARGRQGRQQVWIAAGVGITPFLALLEARQPGRAQAPAQAPAQVPEAAGTVHMHYCTNASASDPLLPRLRQLCAQARPPVTLQVHSDGQRLRPEDLERYDGPLDIWYCGPQSLGDALQAHASGPRPWRLHRESFAMR
ncbi:ferredoxin reductase family protein [Melaminivora sp.]